MYAIFETGGKQYRASVGDKLNIEKFDFPVEEGETVELKNVLMIADGDQVNVGNPTIENAAVVGHVLGNVKGKKIYIFKSKKRKGYRRKTGHRQKYVRLHVDEIIPDIKAGSESSVQEINTEE
jgi:large subunit ribosomal protein L21